jgi:anionic cell wall polymer biosynthesis LytR-Cps2A-Psr (LCP) family protein
MTHEPPARAGRPVTGAAQRLAALLSEFEQIQVGEDGEAPAPPPEPTSVAAEQAATNGRALTALRARVAELAAEERDGTQATPETQPEVEPASTEADRDGDAGAAAVLAPPAAKRTARPGRGLIALMVVLIVAIPVLVYAGSQTVLHSRAGKVAARNLDPSAPGYVAIVEPTPTALLLQRDAEGAPISATVVALGTGDAGGSVLFVPLDTNLVTPVLYVDRLRTAYAHGGEASLVGVTGKMLGMGFDRVVDLSDADWAELVAPVSPLRFDNPIPLQVGETAFPEGPIELPADQVGGYLAAQVYGQDDLDRLDRQQLVWRTWLQQIAESGAEGAVPPTTNGLGPLIETLSRGETTMANLDVVPSAQTAPEDGVTITFDPQVDGILDQVTDAVPAPISPGLGGRYSTKVLNGANGEPIPDELLRTLVRDGAQIDAIGNYAEFGAKETRIEYRSPRLKETAEKVRDTLGGGKIHFDAETNDPVDLVIVLGSDALSDFAGG